MVADIYKEIESYYERLNLLEELIKEAKAASRDKDEIRYPHLISEIRTVVGDIKDTSRRGDCFKQAMELIEQAFDPGSNSFRGYGDKQFNSLLTIIKRERNSVDTRFQTVDGYEKMLSYVGITIKREYATR